MNHFSHLLLLVRPGFNRAALLLIACPVLGPFLWAATPITQVTAPNISATASGSSFAPVFSRDGRHVVFFSHANNLVTNDDNKPFLDVFVRGYSYGSPSEESLPSDAALVSVGITGMGGANADCSDASISSNGQFVTFSSRASNLVSNDGNNAVDIFVRDTVSGTTQLISRDKDGNAPADPSRYSNTPLSANPLISGDGRWVFFESRATNFTLPTLASAVNIYRRDLLSNSTLLVTAASDGSASTGKCELLRVSMNSRFVLFSSDDSAFADRPNERTVFLRDLQSSQIVWASTNYYDVSDEVMDD